MNTRRFTTCKIVKKFSLHRVNMTNGNRKFKCLMHYSSGENGYSVKIANTVLWLHINLCKNTVYGAASVRVFCPPRRRLHCPSIDIQNPSRSRKNRETVEIERIAVKWTAKWKELIHGYNAGCCFPIEKNARMLVCVCAAKREKANRQTV